MNYTLKGTNSNLHPSPTPYRNENFRKLLVIHFHTINQSFFFAALRGRKNIDLFRAWVLGQVVRPDHTKLLDS